MPILPPALRLGDTIGVVSPASDEAGRFPHRRRRAARFLESCGYRVKFAAHALETGSYTAGDAHRRADDLHALWRDPEVAAVITAVGGNNTNQLLGLVDFGLISANPKILIGASDACALLTAIWTVTGLTTYMGPQLMPQLGEEGGCLPYTATSLIGTLTGIHRAGALVPSTAWTDERTEWAVTEKAPRGPRKLRANPGPVTLKGGSATGPVYATNIDTLLRLAGTPYWPDLAGHILLLESSSASTSVLDAQLTQLRQMGVLGGLAGLGFGRFPQTGCGQPSDGFTSLLGEVLNDFTGPVVASLDIGHTDPMLTIPYGIRTRLIAQEDVRLELLEPAVVNPGTAPTLKVSQ